MCSPARNDFGRAAFVSHGNEQVLGHQKPGKQTMNKLALPAFAGFILLGGAGVAAADTIVLTPEEQVTVHDYVTTQSVTPVEPPSGFSISVGATLPDTIEVHTLETPTIKQKYEYV